MARSFQISSHFFFSENQKLAEENQNNIENDNTADILNEEITLEEIISSIKNVKSGKSTGPDMLSAEIYKNSCYKISLILKDIII